MCCIILVVVQLLEELVEFVTGDLDLVLALLLLLFLRQPPLSGTVLRVPPQVQYLWQVLQKWRGCDKI